MPRAINIVRRAAPRALPAYPRQDHSGRRDPPLALVKDAFSYDPLTGVLRWKRCRAHQISPGTVAGSPSRGYIRVKMGERSVLAHRIAWALHYDEWPPADIDHINGIKSDNRIENLRCALRSENVANAGARRTSKTGVRGVYKISDCDRYRACISRDGVRHDLGLFKTIEGAAAAYSIAARKLFGEFARG